MDVAVLVAHEVEIRQWHRDRLGANPEEAADIDNRGTARTGTMNVIDLADLVVVSAVNGGTFQKGGCQFCGSEADVIGVIHCSFLLLL